LAGINGVSQVLVVHTHQQGVHSCGHILPLWSPHYVSTTGKCILLVVNKRWITNYRRTSMCSSSNSL